MISNERFGDGESLAQFAYLLADAREYFPVSLILHGVDHELGDARGFLLRKTARRDGGSAKTDTRRVHRLARIVRNGILIERDADAVEKGLRFLPR